MFLARSPSFTHLSASLAGLTTIRAFDQSKRIFDDFLSCVDFQIEAWMMFLGTCRWFGQRIDFMAMIFNIFAVYGPVFAVSYTGTLEKL